MNSDLQLGTGNSIDKTLPVQIGTDTDWINISAGGGHSHAIKSNGELWAWGNNGNGQLGTGNNINRPSPVKVGVDTDWLEVDGGFLFTVALRKDSSLWTWGDNNQGQLGNGSTGNQNAPVNIGTGKKWTSITAGSGFSAAIDDAGNMHTWGINQFGQLGLGNNTLQRQPVQTSTTEKWMSACAAEGSFNSSAVDGFHLLGIKVDQLVICGVGNNNASQLGNGNTINMDEFECNAGQLTSIEKQSTNEEIKVYPNPTRGKLQISGLGTEGNVLIYNSMGQLLINQSVINAQDGIVNIDISEYINGVYVVLTANNEGKHSSVILIKTN